MQMYLYVIRDKVSQQSSFIFEQKNDNAANRHYQRMIMGDKTLNPDEFSLWCIGYFDHEEDTGVIYDTATQVIITVEDDDE